MGMAIRAPKPGSATDANSKMAYLTMDRTTKTEKGPSVICRPEKPAVWTPESAYNFAKQIQQWKRQQKTLKSKLQKSMAIGKRIGNIIDKNSKRPRRAAVIEDEDAQIQQVEHSEKSNIISFWICGVLMVMMLLLTFVDMGWVGEHLSATTLPVAKANRLLPKTDSARRPSPVMSDLQREIKDLQRKIKRVKEKNRLRKRRDRDPH